MVVSTPPSSAALDVLADATILEVAISARHMIACIWIFGINSDRAPRAWANKHVLKVIVISHSCFLVEHVLNSFDVDRSSTLVAGCPWPITEDAKQIVL